MSAKLRLWSAPVLALLIWLFANLDPARPTVTLMAGITVWVALWWLTEAVHIAVVAFLPLLLMPLLGVVDMRMVASQYMDQIIFLFIGGFLLAFAIERWELHKRLSLHILSRLGTSPSRVLAGIMFTCFVTSMWISNTATVMMLLAAVTGVIGQIERQTPEHSPSIATALLLGLAYSASIGGMATLVGTPTNMIFASFYQKNYPDATELDFFQWILICFPIALIFLCITYFVLRFRHIPRRANVRFDQSIFSEQVRELGNWRYEEKIVGIVFLTTALLWFFRADIDFGFFTIRGWQNLLPQPKFVEDSTVALFMAFLLFFIPSRSKRGETLLSWKEVQRLPFDIILLFGSGFALAKGFEVSGLSTWLGGKMTFLQDAPLPLLLLGICAVVVIMSEFASNVATIQLALPILASLATTMQIDPLLLMIPATLAASLGFMLPVATAPNTIVFGTGRLTVNNMMKAGFLLDLSGIALIVLTGYYLAQ